MARQFKPVRFFVLMALLAFIGCGVTAFYTHRASYGHTAEERSGFVTGRDVSEQASRESKLPTAAEMNELAEEYLKKEPKKEAPMAWKTAFGHGYEEGFQKSHSTH